MKKLIIVLASLGLATPVLACPGHDEDAKPADKTAQKPDTAKKPADSTTAKAPAKADPKTDTTKKPDKVSSR